MNFQSLKEWGKKEYTCKCGLEITNAKKKSHIDNELCKILMKYKCKNITGKSLIKCKKCKKEIMVCGLQVHSKYCNSKSDLNATL
jgi:hypothetical protein